MRASINAQIDGADSLLADSSAAFRLAWFTARGVSAITRGVSAMVTAYRGVAGDSWALQVESVLARLGSVSADDPAELLLRHDELLCELERLLDHLDGVLRTQAVAGLGTGDVVSDADLAALLGPPHA